MTWSAFSARSRPWTTAFLTPSFGQLSIAVSQFDCTCKISVFAVLGALETEKPYKINLVVSNHVSTNLPNDSLILVAFEGICTHHSHYRSGTVPQGRNGRRPVRQAT